MGRDYLRDRLDYCPVTGIFRWRGGQFRGNPAGGLNSEGYVKIGIDRRIYSAHRLAFVWMGEPVPPSVDHVNRVRHDNRWSNLRPSDPTSQQRNRSINRNNISGVAGVCRDKKSGKWQAQIKVARRMIYLGQYETLRDAVESRRAAERKYWAR